MIFIIKLFVATVKMFLLRRASSTEEKVWLCLLLTKHSQNCIISRDMKQYLKVEYKGALWTEASSCIQSYCNI